MTEEYFNELLAGARKAKGLRVRVCASLLGIGSKTLMRYEAGDPPIDNLPRLVASMVEVLGLDEDRVWAAVDLSWQWSLKGPRRNGSPPWLKRQWAQDYEEEVNRGLGVHARLAERWELTTLQVAKRIGRLQSMGYLTTGRAERYRTPVGRTPEQRRAASHEAVRRWRERRAAAETPEQRRARLDREAANRRQRRHAEGASSQ